MESNRIILEFMDVHPKKIMNYYTWNDSIWFSVREKSEEKAMNSIVKYSKYHTDWNWLMEVIEKCSNIAAELDAWEEYYQITDFIPRIDTTHRAVIQFIEWYNKNNEKS